MATLYAQDAFGLWIGYDEGLVVGSLTPSTLSGFPVYNINTGQSATSGAIQVSVSGDYASAMSSVTGFSVNSVTYNKISGPTYDGSSFTVIEFGSYGSFVDSTSYTVDFVGGSDTTAPTITSSATPSVNENAQLAHSLTANETVTWTIRTSAQNGASVDHTHFELSGSTLRWASNGTKNYEAPNDTGSNNTYVVVVRATDAATNFSEQTITVTVSDLTDETAPTITSTDTVAVQENTPLAHSLTANESVTWSIRTLAQDSNSLDHTAFEIVGSTLQWVAGGSQNYEGQLDSNGDNIYQVVIRATDTAGNTTDQTIEVSVTNAVDSLWRTTQLGRLRLTHLVRNTPTTYTSTIASNEFFGPPPEAPPGEGSTLIAGTDGFVKGYDLAQAFGSLSPQLVTGYVVELLIDGINPGYISLQFTGTAVQSALTGLTDLQIDGVNYPLTFGPATTAGDTYCEFGPAPDFVNGQTYTVSLVGIETGGATQTPRAWFTIIW